MKPVLVNFVTKSLWFSALFLIGAFSFAQIQWNYGITPYFQSSVVKPVANDTFGSLPSFGVHAFLEIQGQKWGQSIGISSTQSRISDDRNNDILSYNSVGLNLSTIKYLNEQSKAEFSEQASPCPERCGCF